MTLHSAPMDPNLSQIIKLAVLAVGGQGGGVLTGWIEEVARAHGYAAQATSVAGVSQRTGATVYYVEMAPASGGVPIFSLMPAAAQKASMPKALQTWRVRACWASAASSGMRPEAKRSGSMRPSTTLASVTVGS